MYFKLHFYILAVTFSSFCLFGMEKRNINAKIDDFGNTQLHKAAWDNDLDTAKNLLEEPDIDVNAENNDGSTPLILAIFRWAGSNKPIIYEILKHPKLNVNKINLKGQTALDYASKLAPKNTSLLNKLTNLGAANFGKGNYYGFEIASRDVRKFDPLDLAKLGVSDQILSSILKNAHFEYTGGFSIGHWMGGSPDDALSIIKTGAIKNINEQDEEGNTLLHIACKKGMLDVVLELLEQNEINVDIKNTQNETALDVVCKDYYNPADDDIIYNMICKAFLK